MAPSWYPTLPTYVPLRLVFLEQPQRLRHQPRVLLASVSIALLGGRLASDWVSKSIEYSQNPLVARGAVISQGMSGIVADDEDRSSGE